MAADAAADGEKTALLSSAPAEEQHDQLADRQNLKLDAGVTLLFVVILCFGGACANSLAIMTNGAHLIANMSGMSVSVAAISFARKPEALQFSFGFHRKEIYGAVFGVTLVWLMLGILSYEAIRRLVSPTYTDGAVMFWMAIISIFLHAVMLVILSARELILEDEDGTKLNVAYVHVLGDLIQTIAVLIAAIFLWWQPFDVGHFSCDKTTTQTNLALGLSWSQSDKGAACSNWQYMDPICTLFCALVSFLTSAQILKESVDVIMGKAPADVKISKLAEEVKDVPGVSGVTDLHVWGNNAKNAVAMHVSVSVADSQDTILAQVKQVCVYNGCEQTTIQIENAASQGTDVTSMVDTTTAE